MLLAYCRQQMIVMGWGGEGKPYKDQLVPKWGLSISLLSAENALVL